MIRKNENYDKLPSDPNDPINMMEVGCQKCKKVFTAGNLFEHLQECTYLRCIFCKDYFEPLYANSHNKYED